MALNPSAEQRLQRFWPCLKQSTTSVLLLDYDGTLAPFKVDRNSAYPYPGVRERLKALLASTATRLVIVSGRPVDDLLPLLDLDPYPEIWGCHGAERLLPDGNYLCDELSAQARDRLAQGAAWVVEQGLEADSERKPVSLTLHWRGRKEAEATRLQQAAVAAWEPLTADSELQLHPFSSGLELRPSGRNKGDVVRSILAETPTEAIAFLGDDLTDEDAFRALHGHGLGILVRPQPRPTAADLWLQPPGELLDFLDAWWRHLSEERGA